MEPKCRLVAIELLPEQLQNSDTFKISYAYGDYHFVIKELKKFLFSIQSTRSFRTCFVETCPVLDKAWAASGLGWIDWEK
jgi:hypothetical protein